MNKYSGLWFFAGVVVGSVATYFIAKDHYEKIVDLECEKEREYYQQKLNEQLSQPQEPEKDQSDVQEPIEDEKSLNEANSASEEPSEATQKVNYNAISTPAPKKTAKKSTKKKKTDEFEFKDPYIISQEEYYKDKKFDKEELTYYRGDSTLANDRDEDIFEQTNQKYSSVVGSECFELMDAENGEEVVYVRNEAVGCDFEITLNEKSYHEFVLGMPADEVY